MDRALIVRADENGAVAVAEKKVLYRSMHAQTSRRSALCLQVHTDGPADSCHPLMQAERKAAPLARGGTLTGTQALGKVLIVMIPAGIGRS